MERGPTDARRRPASAPGQTRHTDDGRRADRRLGADLDTALGETLQRLRLDRDDRDTTFRRDRFYRRLLEDGEAAQSRFDRAAEVARAVTRRGWSLGCALHGDEAYRWHWLLLEREHPVFEMDGRSGEEFCRSLY